MRVLLIRHADKCKVRGLHDSKWPLSPEGRTLTDKLRERLARLGIQPTVYLSSEWTHSRETAERLQNGSNAPGVIAVAGLTPEPCTEDFFTPEAIRDEATGKGADLSQEATLVLVGHEPRLGQLLVMFTGKRARPLERLDTVVLKADSITALFAGQATVEMRLPVQDFQEKDLREKIRSKMGMTTFLAGFTLNAIVTILRSPELPKTDPVWLPIGVPVPASILRDVSVISLFVALVLFASAAYIYDRLAMPEGFWSSEPRPSFRRSWPGSFRDNLRRHGPVYAYMIRTWNWTFTPAVCFSALGFFSLLIMNSLWSVVYGCAPVLVLGWIYYLVQRPRLGLD